MPGKSTTNSWLFPPNTREVQLDEKWSFVGKKEKHCDPADPDDAEQGDNWDHVALDAEHRLVVSVVPGKRTVENVEIVPQRTGTPGRPKAAYYEPSPDLKYATVHKTREKGRVVKIDFRVVLGTVAAVMAALQLSRVSNKINTAFVERQNGTDRNRNGRKVRKTYCFSKDWEVHDAVTYFTMYTYNFCWPVRTLRRQGPDGQWLPQTPAMAAGLTDHVWSLWKGLTFPAVQRE